MFELESRMEVVACSKRKLYVTERQLACLTERQRVELVKLAEDLRLDCAYEPENRRFCFTRMPESVAIEALDDGEPYDPECPCLACRAIRVH